MEPRVRNKPLQRALALHYAEPYCIEHGLSVEKLKRQDFAVIIDQMIFAQPTGVKPDGLRDDIASQPLPTLIISLDANNNIKVESTEHTRKYLS